MFFRPSRSLGSLILLTLLGCTPDAAPTDAGVPPSDAALDAAPSDASAPDGGATDGGATDGGATDGGACSRDAGRATGWADAAVDGGPLARAPRDIVSTALAIDLGALHATAAIDVVPSASEGTLVLEIGELVIDSVTAAGTALDHTAADGLLEVTLPAGAGHLDVAYTFPARDTTAFDGWMPSATPTRGLTFLWPYFCGNLFPCHSDPADGVRLSMAITGLPPGATAVYPAAIPFESPSYMAALAIDDRFAFHDLGTTTAGTHVGVYAFEADTDAALAGTADLRAAFDFYETLLGAYRFGDHVASVEADWGPGAYGGMEHHPFWHVGAADIGNAEVHVHEAAHGWFGNGVRMRCWEDFVLSEGTVSYLAARAIEATGGASARDAIWARYENELTDAIASGDTLAYPTTCGAIAIAEDPLWSDIPYMKGAFFYRAVEERIGRPTFDAALRAFYQAHVGEAVTMQDMVDALEDASCTDLSDLEAAWLRGLGNPLHP